MADQLSLCAQEARRHDRDRFLLALFAPASAREALFTLIAFNAEIARTAEVVSEPMLGEIRLQWWRDAIAGAFGDADHAVPVGNHVLDPLAALIREGRLPKGLFDALLESRARDLAPSPPADLDALVSYAALTAGALAGLMLDVLAPDADEELSNRATLVGTVWGLTGILRAVPFHARQNRIMLPARELLEAGGSMEVVLRNPGDESVHKAVAVVAADIRHRLELLRDTAGRWPKAARPVLLQARLAELYLDRMERFGFDPFDPRIERGRAGRQLRLALSALSGSY